MLLKNKCLYFKISFNTISFKFIYLMEFGSENSSSVEEFLKQVSKLTFIVMSVRLIS